MSEFIFNEDYTGPRYTYGCYLRPVTRFNIPDGWIIGSQKPHPTFRFGTVDYPHRLPVGQAGHYDMVLVSEPGKEAIL